MNRTAELIQAASNPKLRSRYWAKVTKPADTSCWIWTGAICAQGHGRFWVKTGFVIVAHRLAWLLHLDQAPAVTPHVPEVIAHMCDNPVCQNPDHLRVSSPLENRREWAQRRHSPGSLLRHTGGARKLAEQLREAAIKGESIQAVIDAGLAEGDRLQPTLW